MSDVNLKWFRWVSLFSILFVFLVGDIASAQGVINNPHSDLLDKFEAVQWGMRASFKQWGERLFFGLLTIEFVIAASIYAFQPGGGDIAGFAGMLIPRLFIMGAYIFLFRYGYLIADVIVASFLQAGDMAAGVRLSPDAVFEHGLQISRTMIDEKGFFDGIIVGITAIVMALIFSMVAANVMIALAELYIVLTAGVMVLGFLGSSWTREYAMGYFRFAIASGVKLLSMQILIGIGFQLIQQMFPHDHTNYEFDYVLAMVGSVMLVYLLSSTLPQTAANMISGHANGGIGFLSTGGAALTSIASNTKVANSLLNKAVNGGAGAAYNAGSSVKSAGAIGGGVTGAAATLGKAIGKDAAASVSSIAKGQGGQVGSMGQRVADGLRSQR